MRRKVEDFTVFYDHSIGEVSVPQIGKSGHNRDGRKGSVNLFQSFLDLIGDEIVQKHGLWLGAGAVAQQGGAVGKVRHFIHNDHLGRNHADAKHHSSNLSDTMRRM